MEEHKARLQHAGAAGSLPNRYLPVGKGITLGTSVSVVFVFRHTLPMIKKG